MSELQPTLESSMARKLRAQGLKNDVVTGILQFSAVCSTVFLTTDFVVGWTSVATTLTGIALGLAGGSLLEVLRSRRS